MEFALDIALGVLQLLCAVVFGVMVGTLLEATGIVAKASFLARPILKLGHLAPLCGASFVTAFVSPRAANSMLSGAYAENRLSRREMIAGALANVFPSSLTHLRIMAFVLIPLLGMAGLAYVAFQAALGLACALVAVTVAGLLARRPEEGRALAERPRDTKNMAFGEAIRVGFRRSWKILRRVLCVTVPIYIAVGVLDHFGVFKHLAAVLPERISAVVPPASLTVVAAHLSSVMNAAGAASELLNSGTLNSTQVFLTLLVGYVLSMPFRAVRHSIPAAAGIFPHRDAVLIVVAGQSLRLLFAVACGLLVFLAMTNA